MRIWQALKLRRRLWLRLGRDLATQDFFRFSRKARQPISFNHHISLDQEIKPSETFANKLFNLLAVSKKISSHVIMPGEIFSFWHVVGNPTNQFKRSRTIRNGRIVEEEGGGLCQASGILYLAGLIAGLKIVERYNHSIDLYTDNTRFTPLGSDATVVYGYKDFRLKNTYNFPIKFELRVRNNIITATLLSTEAIHERSIQFRIHHLHDSTLVETLNSFEEVIQVSRYRILQNK